MIGIIAVALMAGEVRAQYGPRAMPLTGLRTGMRYQPALASPFARGGLGYTTGLSRFGGFYGSGLGYPGIGYRGIGYPGLGYRGFGYPGVASFSLNIGVGGIGLGYPGYSYGLGYPGYGYGYGYGSPWIYGRYPYGAVGFTSITYGGGYPFGGLGYGGFPYGYGYGYRGGYFGYW